MDDRTENLVSLAILAVIVIAVVYVISDLVSAAQQSGSSAASTVGILGGSGVLAAGAFIDLPMLAVVGGIAALGYGLWSYFSTGSSSDSPTD